jgi:hypothetical protein
MVAVKVHLPTRTRALRAGHLACKQEAALKRAQRKNTSLGEEINKVRSHVSDMERSLADLPVPREAADGDDGARTARLPNKMAVEKAGGLVALERTKAELAEAERTRAGAE